MSLFKPLALLHLPWILAEAVSYHPVLSWFIAWTGSFLIFYLTILSPFNINQQDCSSTQKVMRPIILIQIIFAGFMCCTSIFYFTDQLIHTYAPDNIVLAKCQRLSLLAHIALVSGFIISTKTNNVVKYKYTMTVEDLSIKICVVAYLTALLLNKFPSMIQFKYNLLSVGACCGTFTLISGFANKNIKLIVFGSIVFGFNVVESTLTGYKESIIINFILLGFIAFPYFKKMVLIFSVPVIGMLFYILPTFTTIIRLQSWIEKKPIEQARSQAYLSLLDQDNQDEITFNNWKFLTDRSSEIGMFGKFVKHVPDYRPYYGWEILENSIIALIPRAFWQDKPITEKVAMQRVYDAGVVNPASVISAKSRPVVDGYLMAGAPGVYISILIYGLLTQWLCNNAERLFGGYEMGCIIIFNGLFQQLWRGNNFEFLLNNIVYGYILMTLIFFLLKQFKILIPVNYENNPHLSIV